MNRKAVKGRHSAWRHSLISSTLNLCAILLVLNSLAVKSAFAAQITVPGFAHEDLYSGTVRTDLEDPSFSGTPTKSIFLQSFEVPIEQGDNFAERVTALFTPAVSGIYIF